jgi:trans-2,3-dihydro-3-hydroxyanthranilate isomerase
MPSAFPFYIVDVFAEERYQGNQLAVLRGNPDDETMMQITKEIGFSETTFITAEETHDGGYDVRIFTTAGEVPFAGHPTLGTAFIIRGDMIGEPVEQVVLNLGVGQITVTFSSDGLVWMRQKPPEFGHTYSAIPVADMLNLKRDDIDERFPVQEVSTGLPFIIVPLKTLDAVKRARVTLDKLRGMIEGVRGLHADAMLVFSSQTYSADNDLNVRAFVDLHGAPEDAATGSANGCLAGYLAHHRYFGSEHVNIRVEQGYEMDRPSLLFLHAEDQGEDIQVDVGGKVMMIAKGKWIGN